MGDVALPTLRFGVLADTPVHLHDLSQLIANTGHCVAARVLSSTKVPDLLPEVEAWLVRMDLQHDHAVMLMDTLDQLNIPVIYDDTEDLVDFSNDERVKRFRKKVNSCFGALLAGASPSARAKEVWVLGASTGGPEAVSSFLQVIPPTLPGVAFVYAQHINGTNEKSLYKAIALNSSWQVYGCQQSRVIAERSIYIVSPNHQVDIDTTGVIAPVAEPWMGPYSPSIDHVMALVGRRYGASSGAIIFSGMGDDGMRSCHYVKSLGGQIWAQEEYTCAVASMPNHAKSTDTVTLTGSPKSLAEQFMRRKSVTH